MSDMMEYNDDGYIELVLELLARICDGQNAELQVSYHSPTLFYSFISMRNNKKKFEGMIRISKSKDRQCNGQKEKTLMYTQKNTN